jgi:hypothetical protein
MKDLLVIRLKILTEGLSIYLRHFLSATIRTFQ